MAAAGRSSKLLFSMDMRLTSPSGCRKTSRRHDDGALVRISLNHGHIAADFRTGHHRWVGPASRTTRAARNRTRRSPGSTYAISCAATNPSPREMDLDDPALGRSELPDATHAPPRLIRRPIVPANGKAATGGLQENGLDTSPQHRPAEVVLRPRRTAMPVATLPGASPLQDMARRSCAGYASTDAFRALPLPQLPCRHRRA